MILFTPPIVYLDAIVIKIRDSGVVKNKAVYLALGINIEDHKELLGLWITETEGAKFWISVMNELKNRGIQDIFIACTDGLKGFPDAIAAVYPDTQVQLCIVHQICNSLKYVSWKHRKEVANDLCLIYGVSTASEAQQGLNDFPVNGISSTLQSVSPGKITGKGLSVFFSYPSDIRKVIYTTNAIESLTASLRKVMKNRRSFPNDEDVMKVLYLALYQISRKWTMPLKNWRGAMNQLIILFGERIPL